MWVGVCFCARPGPRLPARRVDALLLLLVVLGAGAVAVHARRSDDDDKWNDDDDDNHDRDDDDDRDDGFGGHGGGQGQPDCKLKVVSAELHTESWQSGESHEEKPELLVLAVGGQTGKETRRSRWPYIGTYLRGVDKAHEPFEDLDEYVGRWDKAHLGDTLWVEAWECDVPGIGCWRPRRQRWRRVRLPWWSELGGDDFLGAANLTLAELSTAEHVTISLGGAVTLTVTCEGGVGGELPTDGVEPPLEPPQDPAKPPPASPPPEDDKEPPAPPPEDDKKPPAPSPSLKPSPTEPKPSPPPPTEPKPSPPSPTKPEPEPSPPPQTEPKPSPPPPTKPQPSPPSPADEEEAPEVSPPPSSDEEEEEEYEEQDEEPTYGDEELALPVWEIVTALSGVEGGLDEEVLAAAVLPAQLESVVYGAEMLIDSPSEIDGAELRAAALGAVPAAFNVELREYTDGISEPMGPMRRALRDSRSSQPYPTFFYEIFWMCDSPEAASEAVAQLDHDDALVDVLPLASNAEVDVAAWIKVQVFEDDDVDEAVNKIESPYFASSVGADESRIVSSGDTGVVAVHDKYPDGNAETNLVPFGNDVSRFMPTVWGACGAVATMFAAVSHCRARRRRAAGATRAPEEHIADYVPSSEPALPSLGHGVQLGIPVAPSAPPPPSEDGASIPFRTATVRPVAMSEFAEPTKH